MSKSNPYLEVALQRAKPMILAAHLLFSIVATVSGLIVVTGAVRSGGHAWSDGFATLAGFTVGTSLAFPIVGMTPALALSIVTAVLLLIYAIARGMKHANRFWRSTALISLVLVSYAHVLALIIQASRHVPWLKQLAPMVRETSVAVAHIMAIFAFGVAAFLIVQSGARHQTEVRPD